MYLSSAAPAATLAPVWNGFRRTRSLDTADRHTGAIALLISPPSSFPAANCATRPVHAPPCGLIAPRPAKDVPPQEKKAAQPPGKTIARTRTAIRPRPHIPNTAGARCWMSTIRWSIALMKMDEWHHLNHPHAHHTVHSVLCHPGNPLMKSTYTARHGRDQHHARIRIDASLAPELCQQKPEMAPHAVVC